MSEHAATTTTEHRLFAVASCPVDEEHLDVYEVVVTVSGRTLPVERILEAVRERTLAPIYQEDLTEALALDLDAHVWTSGLHSGVRTICQAGTA